MQWKFLEAENKQLVVFRLFADQLLGDWREENFLFLIQETLGLFFLTFYHF